MEYGEFMDQLGLHKNIKPVCICVILLSLC